MSAIYHENPRNAVIDTNASGVTALIAAPTNGYIVVDHVNIFPTAAVGVTLRRAATDLTGSYPLDPKQGLVIENTAGDPKGVFTCQPGEAFNMNLDAAVQVDGFVRYRVVGE